MEKNLQVTNVSIPVSGPVSILAAGTGSEKARDIEKKKKKRLRQMSPCPCETFAYNKIIGKNGIQGQTE